jgi:hypothetical protein
LEEMAETAPLKIPDAEAYFMAITNVTTARKV